MLLTLRTTNTHGNARSTADAVITALTPAAWYRNATGVTSAGGFASQWDDYSGNARHLVQATGTNQPAYAAGVLTFDGADNFMKITADAALIQPLTYYYVFSQESWTIGDYISDGNAADSTYFYQTGSSPSIRIVAGAALVLASSPIVGSTGIVAVKLNGASSSIRLNNNAASTGNAGAGNPGGFILGARGGGLSSWSHLTVKEIVIFLAAHDNTTQSSVITALNDALTVF